MPNIVTLHVYHLPSLSSPEHSHTFTVLLGFSPYSLSSPVEHTRFVCVIRGQSQGHFRRRHSDQKGKMPWGRGWVIFAVVFSNHKGRMPWERG